MLHYDVCLHLPFSDAVLLSSVEHLTQCVKLSQRSYIYYNELVYILSSWYTYFRGRERHLIRQLTRYIVHQSHLVKIQNEPC